MRRTDTPLTPLYQRYRFIALATYGALLLAGLADGLSGGIGPNSLVAAPEGLRFVVFLTALLGLIGLELTAVGAASFHASERVRLPQLFFRLLLFSAILAFGDPLYSQVIFLVLILYLYLAVSKWVSYAVAALGCLIVLGLGVTANPIVATLQPPPAVSQPPPSPLPPAPLTLGRLIDQGFGLVTILFFDFLLARAMARAAQDQEELEALHTSLETSHRQLQASTHQVAELAATEERNRLARDIHDSLGHHLSAINIQLEKASAYKARDPERAAEAVDHAKRTVKEALKDVRESVSSLREGEAFSLAESLESLVERMNHSNLKIDLKQVGTEAGYPKLALMTLYRAVQEGLTNIHRYAQAEEVSIHLHLGENEATLSVVDTGRGFDVPAWEADFEGRQTYGLQGLRERLNLVGGHLELTSRIGEGTKLEVVIPRHGSQKYGSQKHDAQKEDSQRAL